MGPLGELGALFNPGMRHEEEEKRSKELLREEEGTGRKGALGIDLDSGIVVIGGEHDDAAGDATDEHSRDQRDHGRVDTDNTPTKDAVTPPEPPAAEPGTRPVGKARRRRR